MSLNDQDLFQQRLLDLGAYAEGGVRVSPEFFADLIRWLVINKRFINWLRLEDPLNPAVEFNGRPVVMDPFLKGDTFTPIELNPGITKGQDLRQVMFREGRARS